MHCVLCVCVFCQPLKLAVDDAAVSAVDGVLQYQSEKEDALKAVFLAARNFAHNDISDLLADFRQKRSLGEKLMCLVFFFAFC